MKCTCVIRYDDAEAIVLLRVHEDDVNQLSETLRRNNKGGKLPPASLLASCWPGPWGHMSLIVSSAEALRH